MWMRRKQRVKLVAAAEDTSSDEVLESEPIPYALSDYLEKYIVYVARGDAALAAGYVFRLKGGKLVVRPRGDDKAVKADEAGWPLVDEDFNGIRLDTVVGVMHRNHALVGEKVSFPRIRGAMPTDRWDDDMRFDSFNGMVDVVYVKALWPEGSGEPTAIGVTVNSANVGDVLIKMSREGPPHTVYLPIDRVEFVDAPKDEPSDGE